MRVLWNVLKGFQLAVVNWDICYNNGLLERDPVFESHFNRIFLKSLSSSSVAKRRLLKKLLLISKFLLVQVDHE